MSLIPYIESLKQQVTDPEALQQQYDNNRQQSQAVGCPVFNVFYGTPTKIAYFTTRDQLVLTEAEAQPLIEQFHQAELNKQ